LRKFVRYNLLELTDTIAEALSLNMTAEAEYGMGVLRQTLSGSLSAEGAAKYSAVTGDTSHLTELKALLEAETEIEREIVFMPYKASMWDSLESIWLAAKDDPRCYVTVLPIPYFEMADGQSELHYEGNDFPDYVKITRVADYDFALCKPDIGYIHNAYDATNIVTSVSGFFYTANLKKYIGCLVYVPYFVSDHPIDLSVADAIAQCSADVIIASNNDDAATYRKTDFTGEVVPLGSPKTDRIINAHNKKPPIPPEWDILENKKIFFMNTSIGSLLFDADAYIKKLRAVFKVFAKKRYTAALIWRPHPLTHSTIAAMVQEAKDGFYALESFFESSQIGVIDRTPDFLPAMAMSDVYIGDGLSSLIYLYGLSGKPIYQLDFSLPIAPTEAEYNEIMNMEWLTSISGGDYAVSTRFNALYKLDRENYAAIFKDSFPPHETKQNFGNLFNNSPAYIEYNGKLVFMPYLADFHAIYDTVTKTWTTTPIPEYVLPEQPLYQRFAEMTDCGDYIIFSPAFSGYFCRYNKLTGEYSYHDEVKTVLAEKHIYEMSWYVYSPAPAYGHIFYLTGERNTVVELDPAAMTFKLYELPGEDNRNGGLVFCKNSFFFFQADINAYKTNPNKAPDLVEWSPKKGIINRFTEYPAKEIPHNEKQGKGLWQKLLYTDGQLILIPSFADSIVIMDVSDSKKRSMRRLELQPEIDLLERKNAYIAQLQFGYGYMSFPYKVTAANGCLYTHYWYDLSELEINLQTGEWCSFQYDIQGNDDRLNLPIVKRSPMWAENIRMTTEFIVECVADGIITQNDTDAAYYRAINENSDGSCGAKIHEYIMNKTEK
jgi:hypothetical protein